MRLRQARPSTHRACFGVPQALCWGLLRFVHRHPDVAGVAPLIVRRAPASFQRYEKVVAVAVVQLPLDQVSPHRGMGRRELARRAQLNINTVCKLAKNDHQMIDLLTLDRVCTVLHITPGELLTWEPDQEQSTA